MRPNDSMKSVLPLLVLCGCAPDLTAPDEVAIANYTLTQLKDADAAACTHAAVEAELEAQMALYDLVGCVVAFGEDDEVVYLHGEGWAELDANFQPVRAYSDHLPSGTGSSSKVITAVALVRLWELGYLGGGDLDEITIGQLTAPPYGLRLSSDTPAWIEAITLQQLLSHTSGIDEDSGHWMVNTDFLQYAQFAGGLSVDWSNPMLDLTADELAHDQPGAMPRVSVQALVPPYTPDYTVVADNGFYSNINFAYIAAIVDAVVTQPGFAGYGDYADEVEPGFESWAWFVWTGGGQDLENGLLTLALNHPWREDAGEIEGIPADYNDSTTEAPDWDYFGWEAGAGGWTMTAGDLVRMTLAEGEDRFIDNWDLVRANISNVAGVGRYGLGFQRARVDQGDDFWFYMGHGGGIQGYIAGAYRASPGEGEGGFVAFQCNTQPLDPNGQAEAVPVPIAHALWTAWNPRGLNCQQKQAPDVLSGNYLDSYLQEAESTIARYGVDGAITQAARITSTYAGGEALEALEAGDAERAAQCALVYLGDRTGRWTCR